jgi:hypothetical protein
MAKKKKKVAKKKKVVARKSKSKAKPKAKRTKKVRLTVTDLQSGSLKKKKPDMKPKDDPGGWSDVAHDDVVPKDGKD